MPSAIIGIMSGSSLDGLDMALCHFDEINGTIEWSLEAKRSVPFPASVEESLRSAPMLSGYDLMKLDADFGSFIGRAIKSWVDEYTLQADYIASHGHTVFHEPSLGFTTQIGCGAHIAFETCIDTISNFRSADIAAGGQGAPFAPVADKALFPGYQAYLNMGGIVNISMVTPDGKWKAWDIGPCNQALNYLALKTGRPYDENGNAAASGKRIGSIVEILTAMFPFNEGLPKGLSNAEVQNSWIKCLNASGEDINNLLASVTEAIAILIHSHLKPLAGHQAKVLVTGGGAHNLYLMQRLNALSPTTKFTFHLPSAEIINYKECALMAYLGYLTQQRKPYGIYTMTGASSDSIGGAMYKAFR